MKVEVYKKRMGYVASGTHNGNDYSFAGITPIDAIEKAIAYITKPKPVRLKVEKLGKVEDMREEEPVAEEKADSN